VKLNSKNASRLLELEYDRVVRIAPHVPTGRFDEVITRNGCIHERVQT
jgi:hypothetical protein